MIKIGTIGRIVSGKNEAGSFVQFEKLEGDGGILILTCGDRSMSSAFDTWVPDMTALEEYIRECNWVIEWSER
jgi:hypothetical protein